jgi:hypothetical protein
MVSSTSHLLKSAGKASFVVHTYNVSTQEEKVRKTEGQARLHGETLSQKRQN